jgi:hypothetical protein
MGVFADLLRREKKGDERQRKKEDKKGEARILSSSSFLCVYSAISASRR